MNTSTEDSGFSSNADSHSSIEGSMDASSIITAEMARVESELEQKALQEEKDLRAKMLEKNAEKQEHEEQCYKRLHLLLSRSSIYAKFMAEKLKRDEVKEAKKQSRLEKQKDADLNAKSKKRKPESRASPSKKAKGDMTVIDAFRKTNVNDENVETLNTSPVEQQLRPSSAQPRLLSGATMHPYQVDGFEWLKMLYENAVNGILADEMGLGKTIQSIAFIAHLIDMGVPGPFFVCGPLSTVSNWYLEFQNMAPSIPVLVYHGTKDERKALSKKIMKKVHTKDFSCYPVVITSYQIALIDEKIIGKNKWKLLIVDEAHRIKNFQCRLVGALKCYNASHRLLLTGTPLQNNLAELWSLLNFILPEIFDDLKVFESWFDVTRLAERGGSADIVAKEQEKQIVSIIHEILTPFLLRRTKAEVRLKLPEKKEVIVHAPFTALQQEYYTAVLNKTIRQLLHVDEKENETSNLDGGRPKRHRKVENYVDILKKYDDYKFEDLSDKVLVSEISTSDKKKNPDATEDIFADVHLTTRNMTMLLRKICNHPYLVSYPLEKSGEYKVDEELVKNSGKLLVLDMLLSELRKRGHKVLLFSQFVTMLEILEDYCRFRNYPYSMLCGDMNLDQRDREMKEFKQSEDSFLFLISTKAGGLGINLADADTVIIYDSDWNPQGDLQAQDRCHRIGQTKPVVVYRLIVPGTIDEHMLTRATAKRKLEKVIIKDGRFSSRNSSSSDKLTIEELLQLLQSCESFKLVKTNDENVLSQEELEKLLDRSDMV